ncbi:MAG: hypothetical protein Q9157_006551 [Trypethelium eluteriae]
MADPEAGAARSSRLSKYFRAVLQEKRTVKNASDARLFFEAICDQEDHASCIEKVVASSSAMVSLRLGLRFDVSISFLNGLGGAFLNYLSDSALKQLCNGMLLKQILRVIVDPPTLWDALLQFALDKELNENSLRALACHEIRTFGHKIQHVLLLRSSTNFNQIENYPGGRHDNDFADFRKIAILPSADEFMSKERPFYRRADEVLDIDPDQRPAVHLDNQFRLLREDLLGELRNDLQVATGQKKGRRPLAPLHGLSLEGMDCGTEKKRKPCSLALRCLSAHHQLRGLDLAQRKAYVAENKNFIRHQAFGCLYDGKEIIAFANIDRNEDLLVLSPSVILLHIAGGAAFQRALIASRESNKLQFLLVDTPVFAYEPILKCLQDKTELPLADQVLQLDPNKNASASPICPDGVVEEIEDSGGHRLGHLIGASQEINLDASQTSSLLAGLKQSLSLIQGPPGTGKSFVGALIAKLLYDHTSEKILVMAFTNHALDQYLEDLLDIGIPPAAIVRLGFKSTTRTESLNIQRQESKYRRTYASYALMDHFNEEAREIEKKLKAAVASFRDFKYTNHELLEHLEFEDSAFYDAFVIPHEEDGMTRIGSRGRSVDQHYLLNQWLNGRNPGVYSKNLDPKHATIWGMDLASRQERINTWKQALVQERIVKIISLVQRMDDRQTRLSEMWNEKSATILKEKRIIGCTTTAAAKYTCELQNANPGIIIVEEAGEILESHILTAMTAETKQLVLIGDHQQLRPKVNNYTLTVEKDEGYDLNRSMFERLVRADYPHTILQKQHRMCPEISSLVKRLTYPDLEDAPKTMNRPRVRGLRDRVIFFNHEHMESELSDVPDRRDQGSKSSKQNLFEVDMVVKCVKYLAQQGYGTDKQVILTPYLAQLHLLRNRLSEENDPVLNDIDSFDLVRAGLMTPANAQVSKRKIRISTIDNYQGEESDIVIVSLTRGNEAADIGFMAAPERLNVLLSRARDALVMIGNSKTFSNSRKGKEVWVPFLNQLKEQNHIYDGIPVKCEKHPDKDMLLQCPEEFESQCPDGGCSAPCGTKLNCNMHDCPRQCHQLVDHSKVPCPAIIEVTCPRDHKMSYKCSQKSRGCRLCADEDRRLKERQKRDHDLEVQRAAKQKRYAQELAELQDEIAHQRRILRDESNDNEREKVLQQHRTDLENIKKNAERKASKATNRVENQDLEMKEKSPATEDISVPLTNPSNKPQIDTKEDLVDHVSSARAVWQRQKGHEGAQNDALDDLMKMIGLEDVKDQFLTIKDKVDTSVRQGVDMKDERFSASLLGNPGTGKTTVARIYARFLTSVGALPGNFFVETTGSRLANDGVPGCKKHIEEILNKGGGALFIDEAYQLTSGQSYGAGAVLDFLLAEVENLTGKIVFIIAGYNKQMESFFTHNPGIPSRFPYQMQFADYEDTELLQILKFKIGRKWDGRMKVEDGLNGLYSRIVSRRIGRGRGREGFGNARTVENTFAAVTARQAKRLQKQRRAGKRPDDMLLTKIDLIGPEPSVALRNNDTWVKLQGMIGLGSVKTSIQVLLDSIQYNYKRELEEQPIVEYSLNRVFLGSPGTGKTSVAKLYGKILVDLGLLSNGEVVVKNPSDFVGAVMGESEKNTKGILASTIGKVLVIDEAYGLYGNQGTTGSGSFSDPFRAAIVDTIVAEVQSTPGEDRCVLLLGYKDQMERMFQNVNPGFSRRFPLDAAFVFEDFTDDELQKILALKLKQQAYDATDQGKRVALEVLQRARNRPNFGNAGEIDNLLNAAKARHQKRLSARQTQKHATLEAVDFDEDFNRGERASTNVRKLFEGVVGCEDLISQLEGYQQVVANMKARNMDPREQIAFNFLFRGPPGTGKTTTARKMGKIYYDMGFLASGEVVECSASDLVGQYVGQTGPKTQDKLEKALGKILFIDEAYRLAEGHFAKEAMDEIVDSLTKPKFAGKLITILAGYDADINRLMAINPGLTSRFPEAIVFKSLSSAECVQLLAEQLERKKHLDSRVLTNPSAENLAKLLAKFEILSGLANWANARDVQTLSKNIFGKIIRSAKQKDELIVVTEEIVFAELDSMISERSTRGREAQNQRFSKPRKTLPVDTMTLDPPSQPPMSTSASAEPEEVKPPPPPAPATQSPTGEERDDGVSDAVWAKLQEDKRAAEDRVKAYRDLLARQQVQEDAHTESSKKERAEEKNLQEQVEKSNTAEADDARRRLEQARIEHELARRAREEELAKIERQRKEEAKRRKEEAQAQAKLRSMGVCPVGYRWIKQNGGYRCAAGGHFVSDAQLGH